MTAPSEARAINAFLRQLASDRLAGATRTVAEYQALWPHAASVIEIEHAAIHDGTVDGDVVDEGRSEEATEFGPFRLHRLLGRGGQGTVHLATDSRLRRRVAVKILSGLVSQNGDDLLRFRREAELASRLDHPGICTVYESGEVRGVPYISMRFVEGHTLAQMAAGPLERRLGLWDAIDVIAEAAKALHVAHEAGVLHRDIKPANLMIQADGRPVILDFGLARESEDGAAAVTATNAILGTPTYMSPEQLLLPAREIDRRSDVYSLGATLFELTTGRPPHEAPTRDALYHAILSEDAPDIRTWNEEAPADLAAVVAVALEKDRDHRYQTALALADDLVRVRRSEPIMARRSGPWARLLKWRRRNPALAAAVALLFATLASGLGVSLHYLGKSKQALAEYDILAGATKLAQLRIESDTLWPARPEAVARLRSWLSRAEAAAQQLPDLVSTLDELDRTGDRNDTTTLFKLDTLGRYVVELRTFASEDPERGLLAINRRRLAFAESVRKKTIDDHAAAWAAATAFVAKAPAYRGFALAPQVGLVPSGPDPKSGLYEFVDLESTATGLENAFPERDASGRLRLGPESGVVFVLIPGASFVMGSSPPDRPHDVDVPVNREVWLNEEPSRVTIGSFFISKHELTQDQWTRIAGKNPSFCFDGGPGWSEPAAIMMPVENVSWYECDLLCRRLGWELPTEAQWELAARGGTLTPWSSGVERTSLRGFANVAGLEMANPVDRSVTVTAHEEWDDEQANPINVTMLEPNPFGLRHVHGNVAEWCRDGYGFYKKAAARAGDGLREPRTAVHYVYRGGSWLRNASAATSSHRGFMDRGYRRNDLGVRPARRVE